MSNTWEQEQEKYKEAHQGMKEILDAYISSQSQKSPAKKSKYAQQEVNAMPDSAN